MPASEDPKPSGPRRVTLQDVADAAGISLGAASAALRGTRGPIKVSAETRERVQRIARELNYRPHAGARAMAGHAFNALGVLAAEYIYGSYYTHVLRGIAVQAEELGYHVVLTMEKSRRELPQSSMFANHLIDGVIVPAECDDQLREALSRVNMPHVWLNAGIRAEFNCVNPDEHQGMALAVDHLVGLGHRRIAYIADDSPGGEWYHQVDSRKRAYVAALEQHGLAPVPTYDYVSVIDEHVERYLAMAPRPTAVVVYCDAMAALTTRALLDRGLRVPEDISVVGYEGVVWQNYAHPSLTTVCAPVFELGYTAVRMLVEALKTGQPVRSVTLPHRLEVHESTGPAPQTAR